MSGSGASNLGYGNIAPLSNINGRYVNVDNSNYPGGFSSNEIPGSPPGNIAHGLAGSKSNVDAAAGYVPGICLFKGGAKVLKRKIKNISKKYKMKKRGASRKRRSMKKKLRLDKFMLNSSSRRTPSMMNATKNAVKMADVSNISRAAARSVSAAIARAASGGRRTRRHHRKQRGGFTPPLPGNIPYPPGYGQYQNNLPMTPTYSVGGKLGPSDLALANPPPIKVLPNCTNCTDNYNHFTNKGFPSRGH
jgi:hypothetical protein